MIDDPVLVNDWHPVASVRQLEQQAVLGVRLLGEDLVIWRSEGVHHAWRDLCIHRGSRLSLGRMEGRCLVCPYHGWTYDETGRCVRIPAHPEQKPPARAMVTQYRIVERYGLLWVSLGEPGGEVPPFPEWDDERMGKAVCGPFAHVRAHGPRLIENFLDAAHFPFVHGGVLGDPGRAELGQYEARITDRGVESDPVRIFQPDPYGGAAGDVTYTYHAYRPLTAHFTKHMPQATNGLLLALTPHDVLDTTAWFVVATSALCDDAALEREYTPRIGEIFEQDRAIVESQRPELLPLDLQSELHLRSDRVAIAYRQWLRALGVRFGVA
jgi:phenylpropionate dioxygenase-like ring-hydroxylating dioxygenase large terminal subunit